MDASDFLAAAVELIDRPWVAPTVDLLALEMSSSSASHDYDHLARVLQNARRITDGESDQPDQPDDPGQPDWEAIAAAVLVHDVVDRPKDHPKRHLASTRSAELARDHYTRLGAFGGRRLDTICHAVRAHSFSADVPADSIEAKIVCDADRLDALGAVGIARVFQTSVELGGTICELADPFGRRRDLDDRAYAVDHFYTKLLELKDRFYTDTGRQLAGRRHAFMEDFLDELGDELGR